MKRVIFLASMLAMILMAAPAFGAIVLDFGTGTVGPSGTITSAGVGTNIPVDTLTVTGDGAGNGVYDLFGAGPNGSLGGDNNGSALINFNTSTGAFTIVGGVCVAGNNTCNGGAGTLVQSTTLATGTGSSATILTQTSTTLVFQESDTKALTLLTALGIPNLPFNLMSATFNYTGTSPFTVTSSDVQNIQVPEPTSILLLGSVLVGVTQLIRRRIKA